MNCSPYLTRRLRSIDEVLGISGVTAGRYPPSPTQQIRALIEAAEKQLHKIHDDTGEWTAAGYVTLDTEAANDVRKITDEMLDVLKDFMADYMGQIEKALAEVEREREAG